MKTFYTAAMKNSSGVSFTAETPESAAKYIERDTQLRKRWGLGPQGLRVYRITPVEMVEIKEWKDK